jgi:hypothetical protein
MRRAIPADQKPNSYFTSKLRIGIAKQTKLPVWHFNDKFFFHVFSPEFFFPCSALLWHRLMGTKVLATTFNGTNKIRAYAHCARDSVRNSAPFHQQHHEKKR